MPVSVVVGGQYGSEGKGKVALALVRRNPAIRVVVRSGGTNSGHTGYTKDGRRLVLRQLPAGAIDGDVHVVIPAGSYVDVELLKREIKLVGLSSSRLSIDPRAHVILPKHIDWERNAGLLTNIGSTGSGTGASVLARLGRLAHGLPGAALVSESPELMDYVRDVEPILSKALTAGDRILVEGTQGFGLSPFHGNSWPKATSRDTTAAAFLSEAGLSPLSVDDVTMVIRTYPIRVAGDSGPLYGETSWAEVAAAADAPDSLVEHTSVTLKVRRIGRFDADVVRRAISANLPTRIALNHIDYVDWASRNRLTPKALSFIDKVEKDIGRRVDMVGTSETEVIELSHASAAA
jgi:adenylosuccinate synthase